MQKLDADRRRYIAFKDKESLLSHLNEKIRIFELTMKQRQLQQREGELANCNDTIRIRKEQTKINNERLAELEAQQKLVANRGSNNSLSAYNKIKNLLAEKEN